MIWDATLVKKISEISEKKKKNYKGKPFPVQKHKHGQQIWNQTAWK